MKKIYIIPSLEKGGAEKTLLNLLHINDDKKLVLTLKSNNSEYKIDSSRITSVYIWSKEGIRIIFNLLRSDNILVSAWLYPSYLFSLLLLFLNPRINFIFHLRNGSPFKRNHHLILSMIKYVNAVKRITVISNSNFALNSHKRYLSRYNSYVVRNGVESPEKVNFQKFDDKHIKICFVAKFRIEKRYDRLISIIKSCRKYPFLKFYVAGVEKARLIKEFNIDADTLENVKILGVVKDVSELYSKCHINLLLSDTESLSNVVLESMSHGLFNIATPVGDNVEIIKDNGKIIESNEEVIQELIGYHQMSIKEKIQKAQKNYDMIKSKFDLNSQLVLLNLSESCAV